jgi:hypothetical protein
MDAALITGATAIATGLLGYSGARLQHRAEQGRVSIEKDRVALERTRLEAEKEDVRADRLEQFMQEKRALYCEYLHNAELPWSLCSRHEPVSTHEVDEWWVGYQGVRRRLMMVACDAVCESSRSLDAEIADIFLDLIVAIREGDDEEDSHIRRAAVWSDHYDTVEGLRRDLETAMRADVRL